MKKLQYYSKNIFIKIFITIFVYLTWAFPYVLHSQGINNPFFENFGLIFSGILCLLFLVIFEDVTLPLQLIITVPFIFSHPIDLYTIPYSLFICLILVVIGFILHLIIYRKRFELGKMTIGFLILGISFVMGGLLRANDDRLTQMSLLLFLAFLFVFIYSFSITYSKDSFKDMVQIMSLIGFMLFMQVVTFALVNIDKETLFYNKYEMSLGWATNINSLGVILLFTIPITFYGFLKSKGILTLINAINVICQSLALFLSFSRGSFVASGVVFFIMVIVLFFNEKTRRKTGLFTLFFIILTSISYSILKDNNPVLLEKMIETITKFDLETLNGRKQVYQTLIDSFNADPQYVFGFGFYSLYGISDWQHYQWAHNTFLHIFYCCGGFGLAAMILHFIQKYYYCFRKINLEKLMLLFAFLATDFYGFFDVTYFFPNYMIMLFIVLIMVNSQFEKGKLNA